MNRVDPISNEVKTAILDGLPLEIRNYGELSHPVPLRGNTYYVEVIWRIEEPQHHTLFSIHKLYQSINQPGLTHYDTTIEVNQAFTVIRLYVRVIPDKLIVTQ